MGRESKVIITGFGRCGTTFLVELFTELGLDTGFKPGQYENAASYHRDARAGLERVASVGGPYIVKDPRACDYMRKLASEFTIDYCVLCVRNVVDAANSRRAVGHGKPGGLWKTNDKSISQEDVLARTLTRCVTDLAYYAVPTILIEFPRMVLDAEYARRVLFPVVGQCGPFNKVHAEVAKPELITCSSTRR